MKNLIMWGIPLFFLLFCPEVSAQERTVTGNVISENDGLPLPGVNVIVKGSTKGTVTDFDGAYSIAVSGSSNTLMFSYIGYTTQNISLAGCFYSWPKLLKNRAKMEKPLPI